MYWYTQSISYTTLPILHLLSNKSQVTNGNDTSVNTKESDLTKQICQLQGRQKPRKKPAKFHYYHFHHHYFSTIEEKVWLEVKRKICKHKTFFFFLFWGAFFQQKVSQFRIRFLSIPISPCCLEEFLLRKWLSLNFTKSGRWNRYPFLPNPP